MSWKIAISYDTKRHGLQQEVFRFLLQPVIISALSGITLDDEGVASSNAFYSKSSAVTLVTVPVSRYSSTVSTSTNRVPAF